VEEVGREACLVVVITQMETITILLMSMTIGVQEAGAGAFMLTPNTADILWQRQALPLLLLLGLQSTLGTNHASAVDSAPSRE